MNKEQWIVIGLSAVLGLTTIFDLYTAYSSPIFHIAETNPIFLQFGEIALTAINFVYMIVLIRMLKKSVKWAWLFAGVMAALLLSYGHVMGGLANVESTNLYLSDPDFYMAKILNATTEDKISHYNIFAITTILVPYIISLTGFVIIMYLYEKRKPQREKYVDEAIRLLQKWK
jgi:hypothetical protein